jgi:hypothetical protein
MERVTTVFRGLAGVNTAKIPNGDTARGPAGRDGE